MFIFYFQYFIIPILLTMALISMAMTDLIIVWFFMEISNFLFIIFMASNDNNKKITFIYFLIQMYSSSILFLTLILNMMNLNNLMINLMILLSLTFKLGIPPLHFWMILISKSLKWNSLSILLTVQKMTPFYMLSMMMFNMKFLIPMIILSSIIPPIMMFNLLNFKSMITYSSVNQSIWLIIMIFMKNMFWLIYMFYYTFLILSLSFIMKFTKLSQCLYINSMMKIYPNLTLTFLFMNIASMPPFSFFMFKWFSILILTLNSNMKTLIIILIISSFIMLFMYLNMINMLLFSQSNKSKIIYLHTPNLHKFILSNFLISFIILLN